MHHQGKLSQGSDLVLDVGSTTWNSNGTNTIIINVSKVGNHRIGTDYLPDNSYIFKLSKQHGTHEEKDTEKNNQDDEEEPCEEDQPKDNGEELKGEEGAEPKEADESGDRRKRKQADEEAQKLIWSNWWQVH